MNALTDMHEHMFIELEKLIASKTNPRKRKGFDDKSLNELAATMKPPIGILEPIVVRVALEDDGFGAVENKGRFEIIAGERRWRAAFLAGLTQAPCIVKNFDDEQVLQAQLIENKRREDLDALEEAEGYEKLLQQKNSAGEPYTVQMIADAMGVSKGTIYARMKLLDLCPDARQAFYDGKLDASTALLIARIPAERLQIEALKALLQESGWGNQFITTGDKMSYRKAREYLQDNYMLDLDRAPFDPTDADLLDKAGSCTACPKRSGNARDLFDDVEDENVCTDTVCFGMKKAAHVLKLQKAAEAEGAKVIKGKEAKKLIPNQYSMASQQLREHGYATLDTPLPGDKQKRTLGQVLEETKAEVQKTVVANPHREGQMIETVSIEAATKALREAGLEVTLKGAEPKQDDASLAKQREKEKQELAIENAFRKRLFDTLHNKIEADMLDPKSGTFPKLYRMLAVQLWHDHDYYDIEDMIALMRKFTTLPEKQEGVEIDWQSHISEFGDNLPNLTPAQHLMLIIELPLIASELTAGPHTGEAMTMQDMASELDIDAGALRKEVAAEHKAAAAAKKAEKVAAKPAKTAASAKKKQDAETAPATLKEDLQKPQQKIRPAATWPFPTPR